MTTRRLLLNLFFSPNSALLILLSEVGEIFDITEGMSKGIWLSMGLMLMLAVCNIWEWQVVFGLLHQICLCLSHSLSVMQSMDRAIWILQHSFCLPSCQKNTAVFFSPYKWGKKQLTLWEVYTQVHMCRTSQKATCWSHFVMLLNLN